MIIIYSEGSGFGIVFFEWPDWNWERRHIVSMSHPQHAHICRPGTAGTMTAVSPTHDHGPRSRYCSGTVRHQSPVAKPSRYRMLSVAAHDIKRAANNGLNIRQFAGAKSSAWCKMESRQTAKPCSPVCSSQPMVWLAPITAHTRLASTGSPFHQTATPDVLRRRYDVNGIQRVRRRLLVQ